MIALIEQAALPTLALLWVIGIVMMALRIFRAPKYRERLEDQAARVAPRAETPSGPLTATQRTALARRRRLAR